jgi:hypothetical protein
VADQSNDVPKPGAILNGSNVTETSTVATKDIYPSMSVQADENGIHVYAALIYPAGNFLALSTGDTLTATINGTTQTLTPEVMDSPREVHYVATFPVQPTAQATISFIRTNGQPSAPNNVVPLAAGFELSGPATVVAASQPLYLATTFTTTPALASPMQQLPNGETLTFRISGACIAVANAGIDQPAFADASSKNNVGLNLSGLIDPSAKACAVSGDLRIATQGTWDPAFDTDSTKDVFEGLQHRAFHVTANP